MLLDTTYDSGRFDNAFEEALMIGSSANNCSFALKLGIVPDPG